MTITRFALPTCALALLTAPAALGMQLEQTEADQLQPTSPGTFDQLGASVDMDGAWLLAGSPQSVSTGSGSVYAYRDNGGGYTLQQEIAAPGGATTFGKNLGVGDGWAAVAAYATVYVYEEVAGPAWSFDQEIPPTAGTPAAYGTAIAVDGDTIAVGQFGLAEERVFVWVHNGASWSIQQILTVNGGATGAGFGLSCALSGNTLVVGARDDGQAATKAGAAYVFTRSGNTWTQQTKILGTGAYSSRRLGASADLEDMGGGQFTLALGAIGGNNSFGRAYVFEGSGSSWIQTANLYPASGGVGAWFGKSVALDGDWLAVGAPFADLSAGSQGLATLYERCGATWVRQADLIASDAGVSDNLGRSVAALDGTVAAGAPGHDDTASDEGAVYLFELGGGGPIAFCFGDGSGTACPCANEAPVGSAGGCTNSSGVGGRLVMDDSVSASADKLKAYSCGLLPNQPALLFVGNDALNGGSGILFGDGLRCAGTNVSRLGVSVPDLNGDALWGPGLQAIGGWSAGDTRYFQTWYRDPAGSPCASAFNLSNGVELTFEP